MLLPCTDPCVLQAVVALEDMLYDEQIDLRRERALQQLAGRVQNAMDQARQGGGRVQGGAACWPPAAARLR